jgi:hypothetical protein
MRLRPARLIEPPARCCRCAEPEGRQRGPAAGPRRPARGALRTSRAQRRIAARPRRRLGWRPAQLPVDPRAGSIPGVGTARRAAALGRRRSRVGTAAAGPETAPWVAAKGPDLTRWCRFPGQRRPGVAYAGCASRQAGSPWHRPEVLGAVPPPAAGRDVRVSAPHQLNGTSKSAPNAVVLIHPPGPRPPPVPAARAFSRSLASKATVTAKEPPSPTFPPSFR